MRRSVLIRIPFYVLDAMLYRLLNRTRIGRIERISTDEDQRSFYKEIWKNKLIYFESGILWMNRLKRMNESTP